jgi:hypothetical protein
MSELGEAVEFLKGQSDCQKGVPHVDQSEDYNRGYAAQYQHEQNMNELEVSCER